MKLLTAPKPFFESDKKKEHRKKGHLTKNIFIAFLFALLVTGVIFALSLNYILNMQYKQPVSRFLIGPITTTPKSLIMNLDQPDDNILVFDPSLIVSGTTAPDADVLISTDTQNIVIKSKKDGSFSTVINLDSGLNQLKVSVFDTTGDSRVSDRTIFYSKEKI